MRMKDARQAGFTIPVTMLLVSVLMVLSTAIVAMTVASFRDAARTRNRAEILNAAEVGLQMAIAEIMPGLNLIPNAYYSWSSNSAVVSATDSAGMTTAKGARTTNGDDMNHEFQVMANIRNWPPFADWVAWPGGTYPTSPATLNRAWSRGWWPVPRDMNYDDAYYGEDASALGGKAYPTAGAAKQAASAWLINNPNPSASQLAFPVRIGTDSEPVRNLYWYWLTETATNTPTNTQLRTNFMANNFGQSAPHHVNTPPKPRAPVTTADRDVGIGAWWNHLEYADGADLAGFKGEPASDVTFTPRTDRYNFLNTPVLKKIYTVDHRGRKIRVAVYCRLILREYFLNERGAIPANLLSHMRRQTTGSGPNVIFYMVAVNESTSMQRGTRVQQAVYVPVGPAHPQDVEATLGSYSLANENGFDAMDSRMMAGTLHLVLDKHLLAGKPITGRLLPASGDLSFRVPQVTYTPQNGAPFVNPPLDYINRHNNWVYLVEWNGLGGNALHDHGTFGNIHSTNSALIMQVPGSNPPRWIRTPFRVPPHPTPELTAFPGATPSAYTDIYGNFTIGTNTNTALPTPDPNGPLTGDTRWDGPGVHLWGGQTNPASMSYLTMTELQIPRPFRMPDGSYFSHATARAGRPFSATRSANLPVGATPPPAVP